MDGHATQAKKDELILRRAAQDAKRYFRTGFLSRFLSERPKTFEQVRPQALAEMSLESRGVFSDPLSYRMNQDLHPSSGSGGQPMSGEWVKFTICEGGGPKDYEFFVRPV